MEWYTGIGSRSTPPDILARMTVIAEILNELGFTLRSGGAKGADKAFEKGAQDKDVILPTDDLPKQAYEIARKFYEPYILREFDRGWFATRPFTRRIMARNVLQILGRDLNSPSSFVICWTPDGCECEQDRTQTTGGTGQAIAIASSYQIEIYNLQNEQSWVRLQGLLKELASGE